MIKAFKIPINDCELSVRTLNCLNKAGYKTIDEVDGATDGELLALKNFGRKCLREVRGLIAHLQQQSKEADIFTWAAEHEYLIRALIRGEAEIRLHEEGEKR